MMVVEHQEALYSAKGSLLKVHLTAETWGGDSDETLWAESLSGGRAKLKNVPFFIYGLSYGDVVDLEQVDGEFQAVAVTIRSGHSTYRLFVQKGQGEIALGSTWSRLAKLGCSYERATQHLYAVDVPAESDIHAVYSVLQAGEDSGIWEFEEGHCGQPV